MLAGPQLFMLGSVALVTNDPAVDELQREATRFLRAHRDPEVVQVLLTDSDQTVRLWAVYACVTDSEQRLAWQPVIPLLLQIAAHDPAGVVRSAAIHRLFLYGQKDALAKLAPLENNPSVLMRLLKFSGNQTDRTHWYQRAIKELHSNDAAIRQNWLNYIHGNVSNTSTAEVWRIEADPELLIALDHLASSTKSEEAEIASKAAQLLRDQALKLNAGKSDKEK
jgi:HEAT repeat protein